MPDRLPDPDSLPGADLVEAGIADLEAGRETIEALLVASASERLAELGRTIPGVGSADRGWRLYAAVEAQVGERQAHSRYNALRRRLVSYLRSAVAHRDGTSAG